jgi:tetratricopeptide (TPR) repeat protein
MSGLVSALGLASLLAAASPAVEAERLAASAIQMAATRPADALSEARRALALTADFDPIAYVKAGRKGEVVEDAYVAARAEYRRHRAKLYEAVGEAFAQGGRNPEAVRYLRRAAQLDPQGTAVPRFARALVGSGRGREALEALLARIAREPSAETLAALSEAADAAGVPSLQAEIDRARAKALAAPKAEFRDGPFRLPERARLSTGEPVRLDGDGVTLVYVADPACRPCSADLEALKRLAPASARVVLMSAVPDRDQALRAVAALYRYAWPFLVGAGSAESLGVPAASLLAVGRRGFSVFVVTTPLAASLPPVLEILSRQDANESVPRGTWKRVAVERPEASPPPTLLANGFAPGEDQPAPQAFFGAVAAYDAGRPAEALRLVEQLEATGDWLLPPEARLDRALCLAAMGRREEARKLLLRTGDSRFQDAVDAALERVGTPEKR